MDNSSNSNTSWDQVVQNPQFQQLPADQQANARDQYFSQVVAPQVPPDQVDVAKHQFYLDSKLPDADGNVPLSEDGSLGNVGKHVVSAAKDAGQSMINGVARVGALDRGAITPTREGEEGNAAIPWLNPPTAKVQASDAPGLILPFLAGGAGAKLAGGEAEAPAAEAQTESMFNGAPKEAPPVETAAQYNARKFAENPFADISPAKERAYHVINSVAKNEGVDLAEASTKAATDQQKGLPLTNLDTLTKDENGFPTEGRGFQAVARAAVQQPGPASQMAKQLSKRNFQLNDYLNNVLDKHFSEGDMYGNMEEAQKGMDAARPLYQKAMDQAPVRSDEIDRFLNDPDVAAGIPQGVRLQRLEALARGEDTKPYDTVHNGYDEDGNIIWGETPNMRLLDAAKKGLDAKIEGAQANRQFGGRATAEERALSAVKSKYLEAVDTPNPAYAAARKAYAGPASVAHAGEMGRNFANMDPEEIQSFFQHPETTDAQKTAFKDAARYEMKNQLSRVRDGSPGVSSFWKENMRDRLQPMMQDPEAFNNLSEGMEDIRNMASNNKVLQGSQTAENLTYGDMMKTKEPNKLLTALKYAGSPKVAAARDAAQFVKEFYAGKNAKLDSDTAGEVGNILLSKDPDALAQAGLWGKQNGYK